MINFFIGAIVVLVILMVVGFGLLLLSCEKHDGRGEAHYDKDCTCKSARSGYCIKHKIFKR